MSFSIKKVSIDNFVTFKNQEIPLYDQGLVYLKGENRDAPHQGSNGAGKTILGDAIMWALSGTTSRDIYSDAVIGSAKKSCSVGASIEAGKANLEIVRYRKHPKHGNALTIQEGSDTSHRKIRETEERLENIIGCSFELLRLSCFMYGDPTKHFSRMRPTDRAKILDEIAEASEADIPKRYALVNRLRRDADGEIQSLAINSSSLREKLDIYREEIGNFEITITGSIAKMNNEIQRRKEEAKELDSGKLEVYLEKKKDLQGKLEIAEKYLPKLEAAEKEFDSMKEKEVEAQKKMAIASHVLSSGKESDVKTVQGQICRYCGNEATPQSLKALQDETDEKKKVAEEAYDKASTLLRKIRGILKESAEKIDKIKEASNTNDIQSQIRHVDYAIDTENNNLKKAKMIEQDIQQYKENESKELDRLQGLIQARKRNLSDVKKSIQRNRFRLWKLMWKQDYLDVISEFYSPAGFRPLVMDYYAPVMSECANYFYKEFTNGKGEIRITGKSSLASGKVVDKVDIQVIDDGEIKQFPGAWSTGEGGCVDISLNAGIMRLASSQAAKEFNILWLDEITNGISDKWINRLIMILREKFMRSGMTILFTSHHPLRETEFDQVWTVVKENGVSSIRF